MINPMRLLITDTEESKILTDEQALKQLSDIYYAGLEKGRHLALFDNLPTGTEFKDSDIFKTL